MAEKSLLEFFSPQCPICQLQEKWVEKICQKYKLSHQKIDVLKSPRLAQQYQVMGLPTYLLINKGQAIKSLAGKMKESDFEKTLISWLKKD